MPFAVATRSGTTPSCSDANHAPVRQNPVWISSATKSAPDVVHHAASAGRKPSAGTMKPPSPWIGSMRTAATLRAPTLVSIWAIARGGRLGAVERRRRNG